MPSSDAGVAAIAASLPVLAHLDLRRPGPAVDGDPVHAAFGGLTDVGVCALRALPRLRSLRISEAQVGFAPGVSGSILMSPTSQQPYVGCVLWRR